MKSGIFLIKTLLKDFFGGVSVHDKTASATIHTKRG